MRHVRPFWQFFVPSALLLILIVGGMTLSSIRHAEWHTHDLIAARLRLTAQLARATVKSWGSVTPDQLGARLSSLQNDLGVHLAIVAADGRPLTATEERADLGPSVDLSYHSELLDAQREGFGLAEMQAGEPVLSAVIRLEDPPPRLDSTPDEATYLALVQRLDLIRQQRHAILALGGISLVVGLALTAGLSAWFAHQLQVPLMQLRGAARNIAAGTYGATISYHGSCVALYALITEFNAMSEHVSAEIAKLNEDRQQLRTILSSMIEGVIALDGNQRILFVNQRAADLLALQPQLAVGRKLWEMVRRRRLHEVVRQAFVSAEPVREELNWNTALGKSVTIHAVRLPGGPDKGVVIVLHDTSELRRLERLRQEFVANVSHELKTPLSVITACVETLLDGAIDDLEHRGAFLERINEQSGRLFALIVDLLSLARLEAGATDFHLEAIAVSEVLSACLERHEARAAAKQQTFVLTPTAAADQQPLSLWADEDAVCHILDNLVDNAIKYTPEGGQITLSWRSDTSHVSLIVEDTGIGIPERDLPRIFERFYRVDKARSRELGGTGLGLSIVKHLVHGLHGTVDVNSSIGKGTTFTVCLPRANVS